MPRENAATLLLLIGRNIAEMRRKRGYALAELGDKAKISEETLRAIEEGRDIAFDIDQLGDIADALDVEAWLLMMDPADSRHPVRAG